MDNQSSQRILVTGSSGMLGSDVVRVLLAGKHTVFGVEREKRAMDRPFQSFIGDLTDSVFLNQVLTELRPSIIVHCAAMVNVDACEQDRDSAYALHVTATKNLASYLAAKIIYISTDSVFDGQAGGYTEEAETAPQNYYALTKLQGEEAALTSNPNTLILRTNMYGFHLPVGKSLAEWAIGSLIAGETINGFSDVYFNPLYTKQLARIVRYCAESDVRGIIHAAADRAISKYDFIRALAANLGLPQDHVHASKLESQGLTAKRPKNSTLITTKLSNLYPQLDDLSLDKGMEEFCNNYKANFNIQL